MKFANLTWAIAHRRLAQYEVGDAIGKRESAFSRAVNGRVEFTADERQKIAGLLGYPESWLFAEVVPPEVGTPEPVAVLPP